MTQTINDIVLDSQSFKECLRLLRSLCAEITRVSSRYANQATASDVDGITSHMEKAYGGGMEAKRLANQWANDNSPEIFSRHRAAMESEIIRSIVETGYQSARKRMSE